MHYLSIQNRHSFEVDLIMVRVQQCTWSSKHERTKGQFTIPRNIWWLNKRKIISKMSQRVERMSYCLPTGYGKFSRHELDYGIDWDSSFIFLTWYQNQAYSYSWFTQSTLFILSMSTHWISSHRHAGRGDIKFPAFDEGTTLSPYIVLAKPDEAKLCQAITTSQEKGVHVP